MATYATCPSCKARLKVPDELAGQKRLVKCPGCAETFDVSESTATIGGAVAQSAGAGRRRAGEDDVIDDLKTAEDEEEPREPSRGRRRQPRDDDDDAAAGPRARKREGREDDDRPARRKRRKSKKAGSSNLGLILGVVGGVCVVLLLGCGVGAYFLFSGLKGGLAGLVDNPNVTQANFDRVQPGMTLQAVEDIFGPGGVCSDDEARAVIVAPAGGGGMPGMGGDQMTTIANNPGAFGLTGWYRWKNGPTTMLIAVDNTKQVRVAGLFTVTKNGSSRSTRSNVNVGGGGLPPPGWPGRGR